MRHVPSKTKAPEARRGLRARQAPLIQRRVQPAHPWEHPVLQDLRVRPVAIKDLVVAFAPVVAIVQADGIVPTAVLSIKPV